MIFQLNLHDNLAGHQPISLCLLLSVSFMSITWLLDLATGNYSWVDRLWTLAPPLYALIFAWCHPSPRTILVSSLILLWGARLSFNFFRKGGYNLSYEDHRWNVLRASMSNLQWYLFDFFFIAVIQNLLLLLLVCPLHIVTQTDCSSISAGDNYNHDCNRDRNSLGFTDLSLTLMFLLLWTGELIADNQQWNFQKRKAAALLKRDHDDDEVRRGFISSGLFRYSRHPNFFAEISMWWCIYFFSVASGGNILNWSLVGAVGLTLIFVGSSRFTEKISASKYPEYRLYQNTVNRLFPNPFRTPKFDKKSA